MIKKYIEKFQQKLLPVLHQQALKILKNAPEKSRTIFLNDLAYTTTARFHPEVKCYIASLSEYKRSQQVLAKPILKWLESFTAGDVFYDIGANVGMFGLYLNKHYEKGIRCIAFEPSFSTFNTLMHNVALNDAADSLLCYQIALSEITHLGMFHYSDLNPGESLHALDVPKGQDHSDFVPAFQQSMLIYSLDEFVETFHIPYPTHIKIDVDGGEFEILKGGASLLNNEAVKSLLVEIMDMQENDERTREILAFLGGRGFEMKEVIVHNKELAYPRVSDYLFRRKNCS